ncbi:MAG: OmpH family outer membrane protein, partial [Duganella sp.]
MNTASATLTKSVAASLAMLALGCCALAPAQAQTSLSRIAWLSPERIYNESKLAKLASEKLQEEFKSREKAMQEMEGRLKAASDKLEREAPTLAEAERV